MIFCFLCFRLYRSLRYLAGSPWPWNQDFLKEWDLYLHLKGINNFSDNSVIAATIGDQSWHQRISKAIFIGHGQSVRQLVMDWATLWPEQIVAAAENYGEEVQPWNPLSEEKPNVLLQANKTAEYSSTPADVGYLRNYLAHWTHKRMEKYWLRYKYAIVLIGSNGWASADRLGWFIAHSGAVVLLQAPNEFMYSFSPRLIPWVHYIPLSYTLIDLKSKVLWLQSHDLLAQRIVQNARNFGRSYLRLEDHYCYMAAALEAVSGLCQGSDVSSPFHPISQLWNLSQHLHDFIQ